MKKKIAFFARSLCIGGIGRACINYINSLNPNEYDVTLFLEDVTGAYITDVNRNVKIVQFKRNNNRNILIRKILNFLQLLKFIIRYYHKFYFSAHFATTIKSSAILSKYFSKNNAFWFHGQYWETAEEANYFFKYTRVKKYKKIVFVSYSSMNLYKKAYPNTNQKLYVINNPMNFREILEKSKCEINIKKDCTVFLNVGRHEESSKKLSVLINCVSKLIKNGYRFNLWLVGDGPDTTMYQEMVKNLKIEDYVKFFGFSKNVYPYYKACDVVVLSSRMEGNPVVYLEAKVLGKPIISTCVADAKKELLGYGIVTDLSEESFYHGLKDYLDKGYKIKNKFNYNEYNKKVLEAFHTVIEDEYEKN